MSHNFHLFGNWLRTDSKSLIRMGNTMELIVEEARLISI